MDIPLLYEKFLTSRGVSTDTRQIKTGSLFFALKGPQFNANLFAEEALNKGASFAVVDDESSGDGEGERGEGALWDERCVRAVCVEGADEEGETDGEADGDDEGAAGCAEAKYAGGHGRLD